MSKICIVAAISDNNIIGLKNDMPWFMTNHAKRFRDLTIKSPVIMGKGTQNMFSFPFDQRVNIVICDDKNDVIDGFVHTKSIEQALTLAKTYNTPNIFIIGGENIFTQYLPFADVLYFTEIYADIKGDKVFPELNVNLWNIESRIDFEPDANNQYPYAFVKYTRKI